MNPSARERRRDSAAGTTRHAAICATAINGIARKFSASPANVTREKTSAPTGNSTASAAATATNSATPARAAAARRDGTQPPGHKNGQRGAKGQHERRIDDEAVAPRKARGDEASAFSGGLRWSAPGRQIDEAMRVARSTDAPPPTKYPYATSSGDRHQHAARPSSRPAEHHRARGPRESRCCRRRSR